MTKVQNELDDEQLARLRADKKKLEEQVRGLSKDNTALKKRIEEMRRLMIILLKSKDCYHDSTGAEIAEEISAQFDIGLHDAYRICEALQ